MVIATQALLSYFLNAENYDKHKVANHHVLIFIPLGTYSLRVNCTQFEFFHAYALDWNLSYASHALFLLQEFSPETIYLLAFAVYWTLDPSHK